MDSSPKGKKRRNTQIKKKKTSKKADDNFTTGTHFIVTRNTRNSWLDEIYDSVPEAGSYPVFN